MGQHGQRLVTRELVFLSLPTTSWSYSYSPGFRRVTLFLFPGIPTGDPAIVAFYDKRIYKNVTIEVIDPK